METTIKRNINLGKNEANIFFRILWAELRSHFNFFKWEITRNKYPNSTQIHVGSVTLENNLRLDFNYDYKEKGCIKDIYFLIDKSSKDYEFLINKCVDKAVKKTKENKQDPFWISIFLKTNIFQSFEKHILKRLHPYAGDNFRINTVNNYIQLTIQQYGFDQIDAEEESGEKFAAVRDFISTCINRHVYHPREKDITIQNEGQNYNYLWLKDQKWITGNPIDGDYYTILKEQVKIIEKIINDKTDLSSSVLNACTSFNNALKFIENKTNNDFDEIIHILLISAIEAIAYDNSEKIEKCKHCNQKIFSSSKNVKLLIEKHFGKEQGKHISKLYDMRSKILHQCKKYNSKSTLRIIPKIDTNYNIPLQPITVYSKELLEHTGYLIRTVAIDRLYLEN